jgi:triphosphoribosyl-dephospho-CoA synthetase
MRKTELNMRTWHEAREAHVERRLSPGGAADVLAMSMLAADLEPTEGW